MRRSAIDTAGANDNWLYHATAPQKALSILLNNKLFLPLAETNSSESVLNRGKKLYYLSFARSPSSGYIADRSRGLRAINEDILFVFDRPKLTRRGATIRPVDYWANPNAEGRQMGGAARETEERLFSNQPTIDNVVPAIVEVRVVIRDAGKPADRYNNTRIVRDIVLWCKTNRVPVKLFTENNKAGFVLGREKPADRHLAYETLRDRSALQPGEKKYEQKYMRSGDHTPRLLRRMNSSSPILALGELVYKNDYESLSKRARDLIYYKVAYANNSKEFVKNMEDDLHNMRAQRDKEREMFERMLTYMKVKTIGEFFEKLYVKWIKLRDEYNKQQR